MEDTVQDKTRPEEIKQEYTVRDVIKQKYCSLVDEEIPYDPQAKEYLGSYQHAVTTVLGKMDSNQLREVEKLAKSWNEQGVPREVQFK